MKQITGKEMAKKLPKDMKDFARSFNETDEDGKTIIGVIQIDYKGERWKKK